MISFHIVVKHSGRHEVVGLSQQTCLMMAQADQVPTRGGSEAIERKDVVLATDKTPFG